MMMVMPCNHSSIVTCKSLQGNGVTYPRREKITNYVICIHTYIHTHIHSQLTSWHNQDNKSVNVLETTSNRRNVN
jgi:hypothetical protein